MRDYSDASGEYRIDNIPPIVAFHVTRRLLPVISSFASLATVKEDILKVLGDPSTSDSKELQNTVWSKLDPILEAAKPIIKELATMPDKDAEFVIQTCLSHVLKLDSGLAVPVFNSRAQKFQYQLKMPTMLTLTVVSLVENFGDFFTGNASAS